MKSELSHGQLQMLIQVSNAINSTLDLDVVFNTIMKETLSVIEAADEGYLFLYDPTDDYLVAKSIFLRSNDVLSVVRLKPGESMTGITFLNKACTHFPDRQSVYRATRTMSTPNQERLRAADPIFPYSAACAPIMSNGECIGVITLDCFRSDASFKPEDLQLMEAISHQAAIALEKANLYRDKEKSVQLLEAMNTQMKQQNQLLNRSLEIHKHLAELVLHGDGVQDILHYVHQLMDKPIVLMDQMGEILSSSPALSCLGHQTVRKLEDMQRSIHASLTHVAANPLFGTRKTSNGITVFPIGAKPHLLGYLALLTDQPLDEVDMAALEHVSTVISFELVKEQAVFETEQNLKGQFIEQLFTGHISTRLIDQARHLQMDPQRFYQVLTINFENDLRESPDYYHRLVAARRNLIQIATDSFLHSFTPGMIVAKQEHLVVLLSYSSNHSRKDLHVTLIEQCQRFTSAIQRKRWGLRTVIGIGGVKTGLKEVYKSSEEAMKCLCFMKNYRMEHSYLSYAELGGQRLLLQNTTEELLDYVFETLGPLFSYEKSRKREFLQTLTSFLDHRLRMKETALNMNIHMNTLIYRIKRIEEILGISLNNQKQILDVSMAVQIYQLMEGEIEARLKEGADKSKL
ncbi:helix-turn-helix domain-containing protein [Brevibacillus choshinensis]|uniref:Helix-turn-helix domain-containing protein n=1 Tax=Brevibacillus choshinensis TaxID=54911 RepID=A0ABX7FLM3_BRECH|nr:helix-turn-helix domain-containing protein [Brevibacillus choshinensis]QRG65890.1 helix-turn-helix domain-containing protein [Brevibacillus choshinensis]